MSGTYVTDEGFISPTFEENKAFYEAGFQAIFGDQIDLGSEGPFGQIVGLLAKRDTDLFEAAGEIYVSRDADQATGVALDAICSETGVIRISASGTTVESVLLYGDIGTLIAEGSQARQSSGEYSSITYSLLGEVIINLDFARVIELEVQTPEDAETYTINIDGTPYTHVASVPSEDENDVADALVALILAGDFEGSVSNVDSIITITQLSTDFAIVFTSNIVTELLASAGSFQADTVGVIALPANTLDTIVTPVSGWDTINNPVDGDTGRETETDAELRIRRANTLTTGNATEDAIVAAISNNVAGVSRVAIQSNRTDATDVDSLPPHSFEVVVSGGISQEIGDVIWEVQGAGIASYGTEEITVVDSEGEDQSVFFSRPTPIYTWVKVKRDLYSEEDYPADGDTQIKQAIVDWAALNQPIGKDVIRQRLASPVYTIQGIEDIEITIDGTANPGDTPTYAADNILIAGREFADFDITRITVENLTP